MSADGASNLVRMANQIAANLAAGGEHQAIDETAQHIVRYWEPRMRTAILACDPSALSPIARAAVERLRTAG